MKIEKALNQQFYIINSLGAAFIGPLYISDKQYLSMADENGDLPPREGAEERCNSRMQLVFSSSLDHSCIIGGSDNGVGDNEVPKSRSSSCSTVCAEPATEVPAPGPANVRNGGNRRRSRRAAASQTARTAAACASPPTPGCDIAQLPAADGPSPGTEPTSSHDNESNSASVDIATATPAVQAQTQRTSQRRNRGFGGSVASAGADQEVLVDLAGEGDLMRATAAVAAALLPPSTLPVRIIVTRPQIKDAADISRDGHTNCGRSAASKAHRADGADGIGDMDEGGVAEAEDGVGSGGGKGTDGGLKSPGVPLSPNASNSNDANAPPQSPCASAAHIAEVQESILQQQHANAKATAASMAMTSSGGTSDAAAGKGTTTTTATRRRLLRTAGMLQVAVHPREDLGHVYRAPMPNQASAATGSLEPLALGASPEILRSAGPPAPPCHPVISPGAVPPLSPGTPGTISAISPGGRRVGGGGGSGHPPRSPKPPGVDGSSCGSGVWRGGNVAGGSAAGGVDRAAATAGHTTVMTVYASGYTGTNPSGVVAAQSPYAVYHSIATPPPPPPPPRRPVLGSPQPTAAGGAVYLREGRLSGTGGEALQVLPLACCASGATTSTTITAELNASTSATITPRPLSTVLDPSVWATLPRESTELGLSALRLLVAQAAQTNNGNRGGGNMTGWPGMLTGATADMHTASDSAMTNDKAHGPRVGALRNTGEAVRWPESVASMLQGVAVVAPADRLSTSVDPATATTPTSHGHAPELAMMPGPDNALTTNPFAQRLPQSPIVATAATGDPTLDVISAINWSVRPSNPAARNVGCAIPTSPVTMTPPNSIAVSASTATFGGLSFSTGPRSSSSCGSNGGSSNSISSSTTTSSAGAGANTGHVSPLGCAASTSQESLSALRCASYPPTPRPPPTPSPVAAALPLYTADAIAAASFSGMSNLEGKEAHKEDARLHAHLATLASALEQRCFTAASSRESPEAHAVLDSDVDSIAAVLAAARRLMPGILVPGGVATAVAGTNGSTATATTGHGHAAREENAGLKAEGLHIGSSDDKVASYRGVGLGLYFKILHWLFWMMVWMMVCSVPYLITINTSIFTDYAHRYDHNYGVKVYDSFELASFTFAAIVDDKKDNGTLQYMNTDIADVWKGPMQKGVFLTWVSLLDAGATVVLTVVVAVLFLLVRRWLEKVDRKTREVADYAVIVGGLPPYVTATEIGEHFERLFSKDAKTEKVMDVVLIHGFSTAVKACKEVHRNEQLKGFVAGMEAKMNTTNSPPLSPAQSEFATPSKDSHNIQKLAPGSTPLAAPSSPAVASGNRPKTIHLHAASPPPPSQSTAMTPPAAPCSNSSVDDPETGALKESSSMTRDMRTEMNKAMANIREQEELIMSHISGKKLRTNAAFVTFNTEHMRAEVCKQMPSGWWASLFMRRDLCLSHGGRLWRLWVRRAAAPDDYRFENMSTRVRTNMLIQAFTGIIMFAIIIVCAALITWLSAASNKESRVIKWDMEELMAAIGIGMAKINAGALPSAGLDKALYGTFCLSNMGTCMAHVDEIFPGANMNMTFGQEWAFPNATARLLNERPIRQDLIKCSQGVSCSASYCLPCYCLGLSAVPTEDATPEFLTHVKDTCSEYWQPLDLRRQGIMIAISVVIAVINSFLTFILRQLKFHVEKHWTTTDTELSYAVWSYLVKLINSVVVLLVVNCSTVGDLQKRALEHESRWMQRLILDGLFDDFTPEWYATVGFSIMILMMINVAGPLIRSALDIVFKRALHIRLVHIHMGRLAAPEDYNLAFRNRQFTLEERISETLFNVSLALLFGSGMPLCYLIAAVYLIVTLWWDRVNLLTWHQPAQRYQKHLPRVIVYLLPILLMAHCAFGLWMHTFFKAELSSMDITAAANARLVNSGISSLTHNALGRRITQPNGLALLIWFLVLGAWMVAGRWIMWAVMKTFGKMCARLSATLKPAGASDEGPESDVTYEEALSTVKVVNRLRGPRTYRISHLSNYKPFLSTGGAGRLWGMVQGEKRFTRLTSFRVHVEMEVHDGHRVRTEEREVEMFDVAETAIKMLPNAAAALAAANAAVAAAARDDLPLTPQLPLPPSRTPPLSAGESPLPPSAGVTGSAATEPSSPSTDPALLGLVPSAALQSATLQQVATLQANTGALVKRVSLRAMPEGLLIPSNGSGTNGRGMMVVVAPPPLPPFELDLQPVVVRTLASLRLLPVRERANGETMAITGAASEPAVRLQRSSSMGSASSSHVSVVTTQSAPATHLTASGGSGGADGGANRDGTASEITEAGKDPTDGGATEAPIVVQAEAVVLAEAVVTGVSKSISKRKSAGGGGALQGLSSKGKSAGKDSGPRARATFKYRAVPLEQLSKQTKASSVAECLAHVPPIQRQTGPGSGEVVVAASVAAAPENVHQVAAVPAAGKEA
ncbi:hypothetical protein VOLCADRAFT_105141 [Volvox carteri f. nagariensis]|uniref:CSC1/OSCA1-like cytosolic domain-containing protein n=1 Tax=Volvox carteri f. nagariensis TaxID=3068 RepID=D8TYL7_VOLCA|nr:uncharacterized protein VOLCADRAFT_105141 [Volvox carteri f. nagariensis]EFJ47418.1 hypothetical protein VOLCADRAFT_105141 [Volvox carteri f. nagariensis]|eukprot:XP_002951607.1 hypothetical protein VOLCADRAFT_105141 [Volvox carteri f. nagariensis]